MSQLEKKRTRAEEDEILKAAAEIKQTRYAVEAAKLAEKERQEEETRQQEQLERELKKRTNLYTQILTDYSDLTTGWGRFDPNGWAFGDEYTGPPEWEAIVRPDPNNMVWNQSRGVYEYKGVVLDLEGEGFKDLMKHVGLGQRLKVRIELLEPRPFEEWENQGWVKKYLDTLE